MSDVAVADACDSFLSHFDRRPRWVASAPGRVNLIGEFTDYNDGFVLPMALERRTSIAATPNDTDQIRIWSDGARDTVTLHLERAVTPGPRGEWANYLKGVLAAFIGQGARVPGIDAVIRS